MGHASSKMEIIFGSCKTTRLIPDHVMRSLKIASAVDHATRNGVLFRCTRQNLVSRSTPNSTHGSGKWNKRKQTPLCSVQQTPPDPRHSEDDSQRPQAVIFDMDGVLCESEGICRKAASATFLELYNVRVPEQAFIPFQGTGDENYFKCVAADFGVESFDLDKVQARFFTLYSAELEKTDITFPGALNLVSSCAANQLKVAVASSASCRKVMANLKAIGLNVQDFDLVLTGESVSRFKPHPDVFLKASNYFGIPASHCLVIEDSIAGVKAAKAAGMLCLAVKTTESETPLREAGANAVFGSISEIGLDDLRKAFNEPDFEKDNRVTEQPIQDWLRSSIELPGSWQTDRRSILQFANLGLAASCVYLLYSRSQALSYMNTQSVMRALNPFSQAPTTAGGGGGSGDRVEGFKRYIAHIEESGGGKEVRGFPAAQDWFNAPPLSLQRDLRGKMVVLDFWTYCCINCIHVLPDLAYVERRFSNEPVTVVGVHSAKFDNEKDSNAIRNAVLRYDINHPVVNDRNMAMWRDLGVNSWPTLIVVSPKGQVLFRLPGEGHRQDLNDLLTAGLEYYGERDLLDNRTIPMALEKIKDTRLLSSNLRYPGKIATDLTSNRLFISDSNNHRIIVTTLTGEFIDQIGGNGAKLLDGSYESCCFKKPQGVCYVASKDVLYVADTENHALREVDLAKKRVTTLAGNGYQGRDYKGGATGRQQQLSSPWDVAIGATDSELYVAMAGQHQIWKYSAATKDMGVFSGNGYESNRNGDVGRSTSWAQPSGVSLLPGDRNSMIVADSESSSIRRLNLESGGSQGIAGGDPLFAENLFRFGDTDGKFPGVLMQHPLGVLAVFIADAYNHKIKLCDLNARTVKTVSGSGTAGYSDGGVAESMLSEPSGLAMGPGNSIFIADTNNSLIRMFDTKTEVLSTVELKDVPAPRVSPLEGDDDSETAIPAKVIVANEATTENGIITVNVNFPRGFGFTKGATSSFTARAVGAEDGDLRLNPERGIITTKRSPGVRVQYSSETGVSTKTKVQLDCKIYYCEEGKECLLEDIRFEIPFTDNLEKGTSNIALSISPVEKN